MPEADLSGDVFTAGASGGFDEGIVRGHVGGGGRLSFTMNFELCHGLSAELSAEAIAQAAVDLGLLWVIAGSAEGEALAAAGVKLDVQATVDLFDRVGLSAEVAAFAEASVAGRLAIALNVNDIALAAEAVLSGPALEMFLALLREAKIEAGVWGKLSFAAMVKAHMNIRGSLSNDRKAGFVIEQGAEGGLTAGEGYEFYAGILLDSPKRFFVRAVDILSGEIIFQGKQRLPRSLHSHLVALEFILPATLNTAYELAQQATAELAARPETAGEILADCFLAELQRFSLDKLGFAAVRLLAHGIEQISSEVREADLSAAEREAARTAIRALIDALEGRPLTFNVLNGMVQMIGDSLDAIAPDRRSEWRPVLAAAWLALAASNAIRQGVVALEGDASAGVIGLGKLAAAGFQVILPETPDVVRAELELVLGLVPDRMELGAVIDFLIATKLLDLLEHTTPEISAILQSMSRQTGIQASDLVEIALRGAVGEDLSEARAYTAWRGVAVEALDSLLIGQLLPALQAILHEGEDSRIWLDEVVQPALVMLRDFAFARIDSLVNGDVTEFDDSFRVGLSLMIGKIVLSNVVVLSDILHDHVLDNMSQAAADASEEVRSDEEHIVALAVKDLASGLLPPFLPLPATLPEAARQLAAEMLLVVSEVTSPEVFTASRRSQLRTLMRRILFSVYGEADLSSPDAMNNFVSDLASCAYMPSPEAVAELVRLQTEIVTAQVEVGLPRGMGAIDHFFLAVTLGLVHDKEKAAADALRKGRDDIVRFGQSLIAVSRKIQQLLEEAARWQRAKEHQLEVVAAALRNARRRDEILDRLLLDAMTRAERHVRALPGFDVQPRDWQREQISIALGLVAATFSMARPLLNETLHILGEVADGLAELFGDTANLTELLARLANEINDRVEETINELAGLELPSELSVGDLCQTAVNVVTELPLIRQGLALAFDARKGEKAAKKQHAIRIAQHSVLLKQKRRAEQRLDRAVVKKSAQISICRPQALTGSIAEAWAYGDSVPVEIMIRNVPSLKTTILGVTPGPVLLMLNGAPLSISSSSWQADGGRATLVHSLNRRNSSVRPGVNVLECSYADSVHKPVRASVLFLAHLSPPIDGATVVYRGKSIVVKPGRLPIDRRRWKQHLVGKETADCPSTLVLVDDHKRWRGEINHASGSDKPGPVKESTPRPGSAKSNPSAPTLKRVAKRSRPHEKGERQ